MYVQSNNKEILGVHGVQKRHRGQPRQDTSNNGDDIANILNGKVDALNKFVPRATDKCLPFFRTLKKSFEWTADYQQEFEDLKAYLSSPSLLSFSKLDEELFLYLAISLTAISAALIREDDRVQKLMYYTNRVLRDAKERYPPMEKLTFALVIVTRKLKPYFQAYTMIILTDKPL